MINFFASSRSSRFSEIPWSNQFFGSSRFSRFSEISWSNRLFVIFQLGQFEYKISQFYTEFGNANLRKILFSGNPKMSCCEFLGIRLWWWLASILLRKGLTDPIFLFVYPNHDFGALLESYLATDFILEPFVFSLIGLGAKRCKKRKIPLFRLFRCKSLQLKSWNK